MAIFIKQPYPFIRVMRLKTACHRRRPLPHVLPPEFVRAAHPRTVRSTPPARRACSAPPACMLPVDAQLYPTRARRRMSGPCQQRDGAVADGSGVALPLRPHGRQLRGCVEDRVGTSRPQ